MSVTNPLEYLTLSKLYSPYRTNPHETQAKAMETVADKSGLASPAVAFLQGREMAKAQDWDTQRETEMRASAEAAAEASKQEALSLQQKRVFDSMKEYAQMIKDFGEAGMDAGQLVAATNEFFKKKGIDVPKFDGMSVNPKLKEFHVAESKEATGDDIFFGISPNGQIYVKRVDDQGKQSFTDPTSEEYPRIMETIKAQQSKAQLHTIPVGDQEKTVVFDPKDKSITDTGFSGRRWKGGSGGDGGAGAIAKSANLKSVEGLVAGTWIDQAIGNAKESGVENIKAEFSDPITGSINPVKVRQHLNDSQRQMYDYHLRTAQGNAAKMTPSAAEQSARNETLQRFNANSSTQPASPKGNAGTAAAADELRKRGLLK